MTAHKSESPAATGHNATLKSTDSRKFTAKSTIKEPQHERILDELERGPKTSHDLRCAGIYQVATRILELREAGYSINTHRVNLVDRGGLWHPRCALYSFQGGAT